MIFCQITTPKDKQKEILFDHIVSGNVAQPQIIIQEEAKYNNS